MRKPIRRMVTTLALAMVMVLGAASTALACIPYPGSTIAIVKGAVCGLSQHRVCV